MPAPPISVSLPSRPDSTLLPALPVMTLSSALPVPLRFPGAEQRQVFSTLSASMHDTDEQHRVDAFARIFDHDCRRDCPSHSGRRPSHRIDGVRSGAAAEHVVAAGAAVDPVGASAARDHVVAVHPEMMSPGVGREGLVQRAVGRVGDVVAGRT